MAWFRKKADPLSDRARALNVEIATLEAQIKRLDSQLQRGPAHVRLRSTAIPHGATVARAVEPLSASPSARPAPVPQDPIFEEVNQERLKVRAEIASTPEHYNELGVRKYDLPALIRQVRNSFHAPQTANPKLVSYLAAGGIQGLRPLRKEKRVARNRFIALVILFLAVLLGILSLFYSNR
jgi:hypothetical protein